MLYVIQNKILINPYNVDFLLSILPKVSHDGEAGETKASRRRSNSSNHSSTDDIVMPGPEVPSPLQQRPKRGWRKSSREDRPVEVVKPDDTKQVPEVKVQKEVKVNIAMETDKNNSAGVEEKVQESSAVDKIQDSDIAEKVTDSNIADKVTDSDKSKEVNSEYADKGRDEVVESEKVKDLTSNKHTAAEEEKEKEKMIVDEVQEKRSGNIFLLFDSGVRGYGI